MFPPGGQHLVSRESDGNYRSILNLLIDLFQLATVSNNCTVRCETLSTRAMICAKEIQKELSNLNLYPKVERRKNE